jgi:hypothetical protein
LELSALRPTIAQSKGVSRGLAAAVSSGASPTLYPAY